MPMLDDGGALTLESIEEATRNPKSLVFLRVKHLLESGRGLPALFLSLVENVDRSALVVSAMISFSASYLLTFVILEFLVFREINKIYSKWFESKIPPKGINLGFPMSDALKAAVKNPNDTGVGACGKMKC